MATQPTPGHTFTGRITDEQGELLEGLIVRAYDQDSDVPGRLLGEETDADAERRYEVGFRGKGFEFSGVESGGSDVFIRAYDGDGFKTPAFTHAQAPILVTEGDET